ncbi:hypothetical protein [Flaviaesturariibacter amylovorans]
MSPEEIQTRLRDCEHLYAECLAENMSGATLRYLWEEIRKLREQLQALEHGLRQPPPR